MIVVVCLDNKNGMLFGGKRQSIDRALRQRLLEIAKGSALWMNGYSAGQFSEASGIVVDEAFLEKAGQGEYCFVENAQIQPYRDKIEKIVAYRWNRDYPSDRKFPAELLTDCESRWDFPGNSHDNITEEIYRV